MDRISVKHLKSSETGHGAELRLDELIIFLDFAEFMNLSPFSIVTMEFSHYFVNFLNNFSATLSASEKHKRKCE